MKRFIAILLVITTLLGMMTCLSGCKGNSYITKGELLNMLCDSFGMYSYSSSEPYTETVKEDNKYFTAVQASYEWEIINDKSINIEEKVDKDFLASVLVKSVGIADASEMSNEELTQYAVNNNYVDFSYRGRTDGMRYVTYEEVTASLSQSVKMWSEKKFSTPVEKITYGENTHQLTEYDDSIISNADGTISLSADLAREVKVGDTYVANDPITDSPKLYKVESVTTVDDMIVITPEDKQPELETSIQELDASGSVTPNLTECMITDGLGNLIGGNTNIESQTNNNSESATVTPLLYKSNDDTSVENLANPKLALNFEIDGIKITGSVSSNKISFKAKGDIYTNKSKTVKVSVDKSYDIKDISFDYDYDIEWFKLKYAYAKLNYTTVDTTKVGIKYEDSLDNRDDPWNIHSIKNNGFQKQINDSIHGTLSKLQGKAGKTIKICDVPVYTNGVVSFNIIVQLKFSISGQVELVVTTSNAKGIEYKNGNIRYIKEEKKDTDIKLSAKAELTLYIGAAFKAVGVNIVGLGMEGGIGAKGSVIIHVIDQDKHLITEVNTEVDLSVTEGKISSLRGLSISSENGKNITLNAEICFDYKVYGILKFTLDTESVIGKIFKGSEIEIYGEKNATIDAWSGHIEDGVNVKKCTREYKIEDDEEKTTEVVEENSQEDSTASNNNESANQNENNDDSILNSEYLDIDTYFISLAVGETCNIRIEKIPTGYEQSDVIFKSLDESIVKVDSNGKISAISSGTTKIVVQTKDGKFKQECTMYVVSSNNTTTFIPLSYMFEVSEGYSL